MPRFLGFIKWVVVPVTVGCAGYFVVAPLLAPSITNIAVPISETPKAQPFSSGPSVDVAVEAPKPERRRRRTKRKPKTPNVAPSAPVTPPEEPPTTDAGGSGGAATAGGDGTPPDSETRIG